MDNEQFLKTKVQVLAQELAAAHDRLIDAQILLEAQRQENQALQEQLENLEGGEKDG